MEIYKNIKMRSVYKDNPSDNVIALIQSNKNNIFKKIMKSNINKSSYKVEEFKCKVGKYNYNDEDFILFNFPKTNFLSNKKIKDKIIKNFLLFCDPVLTIIIIDKKYLYKNLILILQVMEITKNIIICITNIDKNKDESINFNYLEDELHIPIITTNKTDNNFINKLIRKVYQYSIENFNNHRKIIYNDKIENAIYKIENYIKDIFVDINTRSLSIELLTNPNIAKSINKYLNYNINNDLKLLEILKKENIYNINTSLLIKSNSLYIKSIDN